jgi:hypothetical protein
VLGDLELLAAPFGETEVRYFVIREFFGHEMRVWSVEYGV